MSSPLRLRGGVREEQLSNFCKKILCCLNLAPCSTNIKGFRVIPEQAVMGRYVMNDSYAFLLETYKTCIFRAVNGRHLRLLRDAPEQAFVSFSSISNSREEWREKHRTELHWRPFPKQKLLQNKKEDSFIFLTCKYTGGSLAPIISHTYSIFIVQDLAQGLLGRLHQLDVAARQNQHQKQSVDLEYQTLALHLRRLGEATLTAVKSLFLDWKFFFFFF